MKHIPKKLLAVLLSLVLLIGCVPMAAMPAAFAGVEASGDLPTVIFYVPETIYLKASDNKTFQYFINREQTDAGALRTSQDTTGLVYFKCSGATAVTNLTCGGASVNLSTTTPSATTLKATVNSGALTSAISMNGTALLPWTVTFTLGGKSRTATAYSVAYAPNRNVTANGIYGSAFHDDVRAYTSGLIFIQGAQVTNTATYNNQVGTSYRDLNYQNIDANGKTLDPLVNGIGTPTNNRPAAFSSTSSPFTGATKSFTACNCIIEIADGKYANNDQWILHTDFNATSAEITVDKSRYSNTNQIPNLKLGYMVTDYDYTNERKNWYVSDATSAVTWSGTTPRIMTSTNNGYGEAYNLLAHDYYQKDAMAYEAFDRNYGTLLRHSGGLNAPSLGGATESGGCGLKYQEPIGYALSSLASGSSTTRFFRGVSSGKNGGAYAVSACAVSLKITAVDKGALRTLVNSCVGSYLQQHYTAASWSAYKTALESAETVLGNPTASASAISSAVTSLTSAKNGLVRGSGTATVTHKTASDIVFDTETADYDYGQTVTVTSKSYTGYNYTGSDPASLTEGDVSSAEANWTLTYTPISYGLSYELNGGDAENPATYNIETPDFTLAQPTKTAYTFLGWTGTDVSEATKEVTIAQGSTGDRSFEANWEPTAYTLTLDAQGGDCADAIEYNIESTDTIPEPTRAGYDFAGWTVTGAEGTWTVGDTPAVGTALTDSWGDATLTAAWTVRHDTAYTVNNYYMNADGTYPATPQAQVFIGTTENTVTAANAASAPAHYTLDEELSDESVAIAGDGNAALNFYYKLDSHTVTFSVDGTDTDADYYYGAVPAYDGETPELAGTDQYTYTFLGWTADAEAEPGSGAAYYTVLPAVTGDVTYYPYFGAAVNSYDITFSVDGVDTTVSFPYGATPVYDGVPAKEADAQYSYTFTGWDSEIVPVTGEATYTAVFDSTVNQYPVFVTGGVGSEISISSGMRDYGTELDFTVTVNEAYSDAEPVVSVNGEALDTPEGDGGVYSYTVTVTGNTEISVGDLEKNTYTVTFIVDGTETEATVAYGDPPAYGGTPAKDATAQYTYTFTGWDPEIVPATEDAEYTAQFSETTRQYPVFVNGGVGSAIDIASGMRDYGTVLDFTVTVGEAYSDSEPVVTVGDTVLAKTGKTGLVFSYTVTVTGDTEIGVGDLEKNTYTITFIVEGTETEETVAYGETPVYDGIPTKASDDENYYTFSGWDPEIVPATEDAEYTAQFTATPFPAHEHDFSTFVRTVEATCAAGGYDEYVCECGMIEQRNPTAINAANHARSAITVGARAAPAEAAGYTGDQICPACGVTIVEGEVIPKDGDHVHAYDTLVRHVDATCIAKAFDEYVCSCGLVKIVESGEVDPDNHAVAPITVGAREATETEFGYTGDVICTACGAVLTTGTVIPKTETPHTHSFDTVIESGEATCIAKAYEVRKCSCGETQRIETGDVDPNNHVGEIRLLGHRDATADAEGYSGDEYCLACGKLVTAGETIEPLGDPDEPVVYEHGCPYCGETHDGNFIDRLLGLIHTFLHMVRMFFNSVKTVK